MSYIDIGQGIKTRLKTLNTIKQIFAPDELPVSVNVFPTALILPGDVSYNEDFAGAFNPSFRIALLMANINQSTAIANITPFLDATGANSIKEAIYDDKTLDGTVSTCILTKANPLGAMQWGGGIYLSIEFLLDTYS